MTDFQKIYEKFKSLNEELGLVSENDAVLAAVSGGRDSTAMLLLLERLAEEIPGMYLGVFHFNHCLRGEESDGDALFVEKLSGSLGLRCFSEKGDAGKYAAEHKLSIETAARELRYGALRRAAGSISKELGRPVKIAVAHTAEDRAETVFLNVVRGTSVDGLEGIRYVNGDVIRPVLDFTKEDVEKVCTERGILYRTDSTNFERIGKRNVVRLDVFPFVDEKLDCCISEKLLSLSKLSAEDSDYLWKEADRAFEECASLKENGDVSLYAEKILGLHRAIASRVIRKAVSLARDRKGHCPYKDFVSLTTDSVERAIGFLKGGRGTLQLGKGVFITGKGTDYKVTAWMPENGAVMSPIPLNIREGRIEGTAAAGENQGEGFELRVFYAEGEKISEAVKKASRSGEMVAVFDLEGLKKKIAETGEDLMLRTPANGDRIRPLGAGGGKSLGKFLTDRKIGPAERGRVMILASGKETLQVFGVRRSDEARVCPETAVCIGFELRTKGRS